MFKKVSKVELISCTAANDKFLFCTSKCSRKNWNHTVCFPRSKSQRAVKVCNHCSAFEIWTLCQESWKSSSKRVCNLLKLNKMCHMLCSKRPFHKSLKWLQNIEEHCSKLAMQTEWHRMNLQHHQASSAYCLEGVVKKSFLGVRRSAQRYWWHAENKQISRSNWQT